MVRAIESRRSAYKRESSFQNVFFAVILERTFCLRVVSIERESGGKLERKPEDTRSACAFIFLVYFEGEGAWWREGVVFRAG